MPKPGQTIKPLVRIPRDSGGCWTWLGTRNSTNQRPTKTWHGQSMPAARWVWSMLFGPIPEGLVIAHTCGNPDCVNPGHMRCCAQAEANRDGPGATLTPADVQQIRAAKKTRMPHTARLIADSYGISPQTVRDIWRRNSWAKPRPNHGPRGRKDATA